MSASILNARHLSKVVPSTEGELAILHDLSLDLAKGDSLAIVGSSGSGKSTLLGLLAGLDLPSSGEVELAGHALQALDEDLRARVRAEEDGHVAAADAGVANMNQCPALRSNRNGQVAQFHGVGAGVNNRFHRTVSFQKQRVVG